MKTIFNRLNDFLAIDHWVDHTQFIQSNSLFFFIKAKTIPLEKQQKQLEFIISKFPNTNFNLCPVDLYNLTYPNNVNVMDPISYDEYLYLVNQKFSLAPKKVIGVTGTSGKSSTVNFIFDLYNKNFYKSSKISTDGCSEININNYKKELPISFLCYKEFLHKSSVNNINVAVLECTSYAIDQNRLWGIKLDAVVFTTFSPDHLDFHHNLLDYFLAKMKLINHLKPNGIIIINENIKNFYSLMDLINNPIMVIGSVDKFLDNENTNYNLDKNHPNNFIYLKAYWMNNTVMFQNHRIPIKNFYDFVQMNNWIMAYGCIWGLERKFPRHHCDIQIPYRFEIINKNNRSIILDFAHSVEKTQYFLKKLLQAMEYKILPSKPIVILMGLASKEIENRFKKFLLTQPLVHQLVVTVDNMHNDFDGTPYWKQLEKFSNVVIIKNREEALKYIIKNFVNDNYTVACLGFGDGNQLINNNNIIDYDERYLINKFLDELD